MTMDEIYAERARIDDQMVELAMAKARNKIVNDTIQACLAVINAQTAALIYAGMFNSNFCKPGGQ
jgi:hypothetical protein